MANHKSALKRAKQNEVKRLRNKMTKKRVKTAVKDIRLAAGSQPTEGLTGQLDSVKSIIDKASKTNAIHRKTASRKISRLAKLVNSLAA